MAKPSNSWDIYLEIGKRKVFAAAVEWPGWCRAGHGGGTAIQTLFEYGPRYASVLENAASPFNPPPTASDLNIVARLEGNATTDFGAPDAIIASDDVPINAFELGRFQAVLQACWAAFDRAARVAEGKELQKGPRGGGRDRAAIVDHVLGADVAYLKRISWPVEDSKGNGNQARLDHIRSQILQGLRAAAKGELPTVGPRGGKRWPPRYFVRRVAWHVLDHTWEIEDRIR